LNPFEPKAAFVTWNALLKGSVLLLDISEEIWLVVFMCVTPGFKGQSRVHLIHAPKKTTHIIHSV
jgi:pentose-5-phosphate-3-epimerase